MSIRMDGLWQTIKHSRIFILLSVTGAVYIFLRYLTPLIAPALLAMLFVTIFGPMLKKLQAKCHVPRQVGAILLLILVGVSLLVLLWILCFWSMSSLPEWLGELEKWGTSLTEEVAEISAKLGRILKVDGGYLENTLTEWMLDMMNNLRGKTLPGMLTHSIRYAKVIFSIGGFLITFVIATLLLAKDYDQIMNALLDREEWHLFLEVVCEVVRYIATYVRSQFIIMSIIGSLCAITLFLTGVRHGVLWGVLAGLLDALPFIGTGVVLVPLTIGELFSARFGRAGLCLLLYIACIFVRELLEPKLIGKRIGVPPLVILLSLYVGIRLFGVWGIIKGPLGYVMADRTYRGILRRRKSGAASADIDSACKKA